ncbi:MAG TPA: SAM-dependent methyltransferase [Chthoniobacterales bacterium]|nr:SAM-dependent methyltransferase [Chthoniobacterales bacterium]
MNAKLVEIIRREIQERGPQPFAWFMEQALYHPEHGYYSNDRAAIGRQGDYFTNISVGPLFGQLLAIQFAEIRERTGIDRFSVVEQGAHHGEFARDVLEFSQGRFPEFFSALNYRIVEPFPKLRDRQKQTLREFGDRVQWCASLTELEPFVGIHFSNELLDSMPINLPNKLVGLDGETFVFLDSPNEHPANQSQLDWITTVAAKLDRGVVLAVDYGFIAAEFREMVQVRAKHRLLDSPFEEIGEADITAHINWTDIAKTAEKNGLRVIGFTDQHHFLTGIIESFGRGGSAESPANASPAWTDWGQSPLPSNFKSQRQLQTLLHPEMLGRSFQVLAMTKDIDLAPPLSGFKFGRDAREALGL